MLRTVPLRSFSRMDSLALGGRFLVMSLNPTIKWGGKHCGRAPELRQQNGIDAFMEGFAERCIDKESFAEGFKQV